MNRAGRITSDSRSLTGIGGDAGTGTQSFTYDALSRLTGSTGLAASRSYQYDLDGNRTRRTEGAVTTDYAYDRADQLQQQTIGATTRTFDYDRYGNLTSGWDGASAQTTYAYDEANRLTTISPPGGAGTQVTGVPTFRTRDLRRRGSAEAGSNGDCDRNPCAGSVIARLCAASLLRGTIPTCFAGQVTHPASRIQDQSLLHP